MTAPRRIRRVILLAVAALIAGLMSVTPTTPVLADQNEGGRADLVINQRKIAAGGAHTCALLDTGRVQCWGGNQLGEMGNDTVAVPLAARLVKNVELATAIAAGVDHTCALIYNGTVKCWGLNGSGQLGNGSIGVGHSDEGVSVVGLTDATAIASGGFHTCALRESGSVVCWGHDGSGQLGNGPEAPLDPAGGTSLVPVPVSGISNATAIAGGEFHTCAMLATGAVKCWGENGFGQLGNGTTTDTDTPVSVSGIPDGDDRVAWAIAAGYGHTCAVVEVEDEANPGEPLSALLNSRLLCWGDNSQGQLGNNTKTNSSSPIVVQRDTDPDPFVYDLAVFTGATSITAGQFHTCLRRFGSTLWCWGNASRGQVGNGTTGEYPTNPFLPETERQMWKTPQQVSGGAIYTAVTAGGFHTCALAGTSMSCWGYNHHGQIGHRTTLNATPISVTSLSGATAVATGTNHACALVEGSGDPPPLSAKCWGSNANGALGAGFNPADVANTMAPVAVVGATDNDAIVAGNGHSCVQPAASPGAPQCWGLNLNGQLGNGNTTDALSPVSVGGPLTTATQLSAHGTIAAPNERGHTCARLSDGTAKCWGRNADGQLGNGTNTDSSTPVPVKYDHDNDTSTDPVVLTGITSVATGGLHSCARMDDATIRCWGNNSERQLGTVSASGSNLAVVTVYDHDNNPATDPVPLDSSSAVASGAFHNCVVRTSGFYRCWGDNSQGQLGDGTQTDRPFAVLVSGIPNGTNRSRDIVAGDYHTCGVLSNTSVRCWGDNSLGQLGTGSTSDFISTPVEPVGLGNDAADEAEPISGFYVGNVSAGRHNTCASRVAKDIVCWGDNTHGQLGYGFGDINGTDARSPIAVNVLTGAIGGNLVPTPKNDSYTTNPGVAVNVAVAANDTDMDGDTLTFAITDNPDHGMVSAFNTSTGTGTYTPNAGYCGPDSFTYSASDGTATPNPTAVVSIMVTCPNSGPTADPDIESTTEDTPITIDVLANDTDPEGDALSITAVTAPADGTAAIVSGMVDYTPDLDFCGVNTFDYTVADSASGNSDDTATVTVSVGCVNDLPVAADDNAAATEDTPTVINVVANDTDAEDPSGLAPAVVSMPSNGTATVTSPTDVTYTPNANHCGGTDSFTYMVSDPDGGTDTATVNITSITCAGDAPSATDDSANTPEDTPVIVAVLANDTDGDSGDSLSVQSTTNGTSGTVTTDGTTATYKPNLDFCGVDTFTYTVEDSTGNTDSGKVTVNVNCGNDAPIANPDNVATDEDTPLGVNPLANDSDPDGDAMTLTSVTDPPNGGAIVQMGGGVLYSPDANYCGSDTFDYTVTDGNGGVTNGTVTITVTCVNDPPVLAPLADQTTEWGTVVTATAVATDPDSVVTYSLVSPPVGAAIDPGTGAFSWTPANTQTGQHTLTVRASDGTLSDDESFEVIVTGRATALDYTGPATGEYSDPVALTATLTDAGGGVGGKTVRFAIGSQEVFAATDGAGIATASITLDGVAGPTTLSASFAGDGDYAGSSESVPFTVERETITTSFTGVHLTLTSASTGSVTLSAALVEPGDGNPGAGPAGAKVDFGSHDGTTLCSAIATATGSGEATATCVAPNLGLGSRAVIVQVTDGRYRSDVDVSAFSLAQSSTGSSAGGGRIGSGTPDDFAFRAQPAKKGSPVSGDAVHVYRSGSNAIIVSSTTLSSFTKSCTSGKTKTCSASVQATGAQRRSVALSTGVITFLGGTSSLSINASDLAEPNGAGVDTYGVSISAPDSRALASTPITVGNIRVL